MFGYKNKKGGFTLIELLVVISIISLLSSVVLSSLNDARAKARDARRMSDIKQIQNALEMYRNDKGEYPILSVSTAGTADTGSETRWLSLQSSLVNNKYITALPTDPKPNIEAGGATVYANTKNYAYTYYSIYQANNPGCPAGQWYFLAYRLETNKNTRGGPGVTGCSNGTIYRVGTTDGIVTVGVGK
jgi:type II secretion system protein G